jgi:adenylate cyclase
MEDAARLAELEVAGLYDPQAPNAADRLALLEWLIGRGVTLEQLVRARDKDLLTGLAGDLALRGDERLTLLDVATASGLTTAEVEAIRLAAGLPPVDPATPAFTAGDAAAIAGFLAAGRLFGREPVLQFSRVIGSALARIADAAVSLFTRTIEIAIRSADAGDLALARANLEAIQAFGILPPVIDSMLRWHLETAMRRFREGRDPQSLETARLTVGFVDVVGFTPLARTKSAHDLGVIVDRFEALTTDVTAAHGGRVVKLIGDAVMFVTVRGSDACEIALTLVERFGADGVVTPRGGLACGPILARSGDYYGATVNLASRIGDLAVPNEILVTSDLAADVDASRAATASPSTPAAPGTVPSPTAAYRFEPAGKRMLKGFDEPVPLLSLSRA